MSFWFNNSPEPNLLSADDRFDLLNETDPKFEASFSNIQSFLYPPMFKLMKLDSVSGCFTIINDPNIIQKYDYDTDTNVYVDMYDIYKDIDYMEEAYEKQLRKEYTESGASMPIIYFPRISYLKSFYEVIHDTLVQRDKSGYQDELIMSENEKINGYELFNVSGKPIMRKTDYDQFQKYWTENKLFTFEEFEAEYDSEACTEWYKMNRQGDHYAGFYKYAEGTNERDNAWSLTRSDNCVGLWELPYPKHLILKVMKYACDTSIMESVRYVNFICEWIKRKMIHIQNISEKMEPIK